MKNSPAGEQQESIVDPLAETSFRDLQIAWNRQQERWNNEQLSWNRRQIAINMECSSFYDKQIKLNEMFLQNVNEIKKLKRQLLFFRIVSHLNILCSLLLLWQILH